MDKQTLKLQTVEVPVSDLRPAIYNPRFWSEKSISDLTKSIKDDGFLIPILANSNKSRYGTVIAGHFRLKIAKDLGYKTVPVNFIDISDVEKEKRLNLTLNRVSGDWDYELLKSFDIDLLLESGFDDLDFTHIFDDALGIEDDDFDAEKEAAKIKTPRTKLGDLIYLGGLNSHRLICGDNNNPQVVARLMGLDKANILHFDPIYNIDLNYNKGVGNKGTYGSRKVNDKKPDNEYRAFLKTVFQNALVHTLPDCHVFSFCDQSYIWMLQELFGELGIDKKRVCLWIKNNANMTPQVAFNKCFEPCIYGIRGNPYLSPIHNLNEVLNKEVGTGNRLTDDVMDLFDIWLAKRVTGQDYEHPTQKPPTLYEKAFRRCTKAGDIILDLFGGSGSQLIAAEQLKRRAFLCEIDPVFCDVIVARYQQLTGKEAMYVNPKE